jgi:dihydroorotate dehydrogenase electron transfer subunit
MKKINAKILSNTSRCGDFYELEFTWDKTAGQPLPGQFFTIRISEDSVPLLRRPFAFSSYDADRATAAMLYQKRGKGTGILAGKAADDTLDVLGPLGSHFPLPDKGKNALLVAGGIGLGPIAFLAQTFRRQKVPVQAVFGCRTAALVPKGDSFATLAAVICTDDGSEGFKGTVGDYLKSIERSVKSDTVLYACGPLPMLKACHGFALSRGGECFVSVEQVMACGVGACMGCAVKASEGGYKRACTEGPVFNSKELEWGK